MNPNSFDCHLIEVRQCIEGSAVPNAIKEQILEHSDEQQYLFLRLAYAFFTQYPGIKERDKVYMSAATYWSATAVYAIDHVLDLQVSGPELRPIYQNSHFCFLESQRLLAYLFPANSPFWQAYYTRYTDHFRELELSASMERLDQKQYKKLLSCKYALIHVVIDMLDHLTDQRHMDRSFALHHLLDTFTYGYNLPNEVKGLKTDLETGVNNYAYWRLRDRLVDLEFEIVDDPERLHGLLYATGLAQELLNEANDTLEEVIRQAVNIDLPDFACIVRKRIDENSRRLDSLGTYFAQLDAAAV